MSQVEIVVKVIMFRKHAFIALGAFLLALIGAFLVYLNPTTAGFISIVLSLPFTGYVVTKTGPLWVVRRIRHIISDDGKLSIESMEPDSDQSEIG